MLTEGLRLRPIGSNENSYTFFNEEAFGIDRPLQQLVDYFASVARRLQGA